MITAKDLGKEVKLEGIVVKIGKPYVRITNAKFECPSCGTIISVIQNDRRLREPKRCSCGRKYGFRIIDTEQREGQDIYVSEKGTEFGYIVYLEEKELIRKLTKIQEDCGVKVKGLVQLEFAKNSAIGDLVIFATKLERKVKK